jgi:phage head maturation protease
LSIKKTLTFEVKQIGAPEDRTLRFIGSTEAVDRDNDILEVAGWKLDNYQKNPVFLWAHDYRQPPIGKAVNVVADPTAKQLIFDIQFASADEYPFADTIYKLYLGGYMRATSVGFMPLKYKRRDDDAVLDKPEWQRGTRFVEQELLELSAVPVPSNPQALMQARSKGINIEEIEKSISPVEVDTEKQIVSIRDENGEARSFSFELLKSIGEQDLKDFAEWKAGATLSAKNKERLQNSINYLQEIADDAGMNQEAGDDAGKSAEGGERKSEVTINLTEELKGILSEIKQAAETMKNTTQTEANQIGDNVIDLDAIEIPEKTADDNELKVEPETLKQVIADVVKEALDKARGKIN